MAHIKSVLILSIVTLIFFSDMAFAGPIAWSYSSQGYVTNDGFYLTDMPLTTVQTESGQQSYIRTYTDYGPKEGWSNDKYGERYGPVAAYLTITDLASGASAEKTIEYTFFEHEGQILTELFEPQTQRFTLGEHAYQITAGPDYEGVNVMVTQLDEGHVHTTPEPSTLAIAGIGLTNLGVMRRRCRV